MLNIGGIKVAKLNLSWAHSISPVSLMVKVKFVKKKGDELHDHHSLVMGQFKFVEANVGILKFT